MPEEVHKGQFLFREKEEADYVYIVKSGEFKITKDLLVAKDEVEVTPTSNLQELLKVRNNEKRERMASHRSGYKKETIEVAIVGDNNVIGEEDVIREGVYQTSC